MMLKKLLISFVLMVQLLVAQNYGSMQFTNYAYDKKSAFSLTFDDGLLTHFKNVGPILNQYNFKGTFYVIPPYLTEALPAIWRYGTWPQFQSLALEGHEIGSHTMRHYDLTSLPWGNINDDSTLLYELYQSKLFIEQKIPSPKCISLNYPYTLRNSLVDSATSLFYENGRTLGQVANDSILSGDEWYSLKAKVVEFNLPRNSVSDDLDELYAFLTWTQNAINNKQWGMIIIHDVIPFSQLDSLIGQIYQPVTNEWLGWLCDWLWVKSNSKDVWVETVGNVTRYMKERAEAQYQIVSSSNQLIQILVSDNLDNSIFNYPLSAYVKIPNEWNYVRSEQNGVVDTLTSIVNDSGRFVLVRVIPDNGILNLTPITTTNVEDESIDTEDFILYQNYPNPFNPSTTINWYSPVDGWQTIKLFDALGQEVETILSEFLEAGAHSKLFTPNSKLPSGVYYCQLRAGDFVETRKMVLMK